MSQKFDYVSDSVIVSSSAPLELNLTEQLGRAANIGWIVVDSGTIKVQVNGIEKPDITLNVNDVINFKKDDEWVISKVRITTTTTATIRYFFKRRSVITA